MKFFREFSKSYRDTKLLKAKYRIITSLVGVIGVSIGFTVLYFISVTLADVLSIDPSGCVKCQQGGWVWMSLVLIGIPFFFYLGAALVAAALSIFLLINGKFTKEEALDYSLYSKYPSSWLNEDV
jgi:hypothetical protein